MAIKDEVPDERIQASRNTREQLILWSVGLEDAVAGDHPVRLFDQILKSESFAEVFNDLASGICADDGSSPLFAAGSGGFISIWNGQPHPLQPAVAGGVS